MQTNFQETQMAARPSDENRAFQRIAVNLSGRLMLENQQEFDCVAADMSPGDVYFSTIAMPHPGEKIIAYIDNLGRLEGVVARVMPAGGFVMTISATERKREKLAAQLTWIANKQELGLPEDRKHDRFVPRQSLSELMLDDGRRYPCRIIDLSLSGAAVDIEVRPAIGTMVRLGHMHGRVVRQFQEGVAIEFTTAQSHDMLADMM